MTWWIRAAESGYVPDLLLRAGIRGLLRARLRDAGRDWADAGESGLVRRLSEAPIASEPELANEQHYELPAPFFRLMLGPRLKYSACLWESPDGSPVESLAAAEQAMLRLTCARARIEDGMAVLDLGCGWGSLGLWIAEQFPGCRVTAVSNSRLQQEFIGERAAALGLGNVETRLADVNDFEPGRRFDRVVSIEMFEHVRNYGRLLARIANWLEPEGRLFVHIFCHRELGYLYEQEGPGDWMARHFFSGGVMPSRTLLERFDADLRVRESWSIDGTHYARTLEAWLERIDADREEALSILGRHYGPDDAKRWFVRWRLFLLGCAELFAYRRGREWMVGHYLLERSRGPRTTAPSLQ